MESVCTGTRGLDVECWLSIGHSPTPSRWYRGHAKPGDCQMVLTSSPGLCSSCRRNWHSDTVTQCTLVHSVMRNYKCLSNFSRALPPACLGQQGCEMSIFLHRQKFEFKILPKKRVLRDWYVFATKHVNPGPSKSLLDWFATFIVQVDIFLEFGLNVNVPSWLKSPHLNIEFRIWAKCTLLYRLFS